MPVPPPAVTAAIDSAFNALLLEALFCGLYTLLFAYILGSLLRKQNKKAYAAALTLLWVLVMLTFSLDWQYHRTAFVLHNDSPIEIANAIVNDASGKSVAILDNISSFSCNWLADAILIWRCYILWENKRWALLPLPVLLLADIALGLLTIISAVTPSTSIGPDSYIFLVSFFAVSIVITFVGTFLIILRIVLVTRNSPLTTNISAYRNIQRIVVESGIIYTIAMFLAGVTLAINLTRNRAVSIPTLNLVTYTEALLVPCSGIGPTLIALRVGNVRPTQTNAGASPTRSRSGVLSHLTFRRTVRQNHTFDISADGESGHGDSPLDFSIGRVEHGGQNEKM